MELGNWFESNASGWEITSSESFENDPDYGEGGFNKEEKLEERVNKFLGENSPRSGRSGSLGINLKKIFYTGAIIGSLLLGATNLGGYYSKKTYNPVHRKGKIAAVQEVKKGELGLNGLIGGLTKPQIDNSLFEPDSQKDDDSVTISIYLGINPWSVTWSGSNGNYEATLTVTDTLEGIIEVVIRDSTLRDTLFYSSKTFSRGEMPIIVKLPKEYVNVGEEPPLPGPGDGGKDIGLKVIGNSIRNDLEESVRLEIYNVAGRRVGEIEIPGNGFASPPQLPNGVYVVRIVDGRGNVKGGGKFDVVANRIVGYNFYPNYEGNQENEGNTWTVTATKGSPWARGYPFETKDPRIQISVTTNSDEYWPMDVFPYWTDEEEKGDKTIVVLLMDRYMDIVDIWRGGNVETVETHPFCLRAVTYSWGRGAVWWQGHRGIAPDYPIHHIWFRNVSGEPDSVIPRRVWEYIQMVYDALSANDLLEHTFPAWWDSTNIASIEPLPDSVNVIGVCDVPIGYYLIDYGTGVAATGWFSDPSISDPYHLKEWKTSAHSATPAGSMTFNNEFTKGYVGWPDTPWAGIADLYGGSTHPTREDIAYLPMTGIVNAAGWEVDTVKLPDGTIINVDAVEAHPLGSERYDSTISNYILPEEWEQ